MIEPQATRARSLCNRKGAGRSGKQVVCDPVKRIAPGQRTGCRIWAIRRSREQIPNIRSQSHIIGIARADQQVDQLLLGGGGLQDARVGQDGSSCRFAPDQTFIGGKEECPIPLDWTAECEAWLVAFERRVIRLSSGESVARIEPLIAKIVIYVSVKLIFSALGD